MCLEYLERFVSPGCATLDVGAGSGILSVAARLLGAGRVIACDTDTEAALVCRERLESASVFVGSADAAASASFDVVVANISAPAVRDLAGEFRRVVRPGGTIIVSGFTEIPFPARPRHQMRRGEWLCAVL
jgi:ribosomal protein L11 methyltransferase